MRASGRLTLIVVAALMMALPPSPAPAAPGGHLAIAPFSALQLNGRFVLDLTTAARQSVRLTGDPYLIENLRIGVTQGVLSITRPRGLDLPRHETVTITITTPAITSIDLRGLIHASMTGLAGAAFSLTNNGAAAATLTGSVGRFTLISRGVASIDAGHLYANTVTTLVRGQGNLLVFARRQARITLYGEGRVEVFGHPPIHQFKTLAYGVISLK
ncbi:GIN domain-containing protein [Acidiphilium sp.]|uniref:GIN domain-containing protein n=1 Tax=Acidiphilium sp. TaxID=527 RepID=UPI003D03D4AE